MWGMACAKAWAHRRAWRNSSSSVSLPISGDCRISPVPHSLDKIFFLPVLMTNLRGTHVVPPEVPSISFFGWGSSSKFREVK